MSTSATSRHASLPAIPATTTQRAEILAKTSAMVGAGPALGISAMGEGANGKADMEGREVERKYSLEMDIELADGRAMPAIQLGVYEMSEEEAGKAVEWALEAGYRGVDSASLYDNEKAAGSAITTYLARKPDSLAVHFTTKLRPETPPSQVSADIANSLSLSTLPAISLYLLHAPYGGPKARLNSWLAVCEAITSGNVLSGGVSNFGLRHLQELIDARPRYLPVVNQIELHPFNYRTRLPLVEFCRRNGIVIQAYAPLVRGERMQNETLKAIAGKKGCSVAQVLVRWGLQKGFCVLPKSVKKERILENCNVSWFDLSDKDMEELDGLDEGLCTDWNPLNCE
ncbi:MAG: hypothetical protein Q9227_004838 [Pyrenula ochraceoflavens]